MPQKKKKTSDSRIASLKLQNAEYNELYRRWRIEHKSDVGFYFAENSEEFAWRDGEGFIAGFPVAEERSAMMNTATVIGKNLTIYALVNLAVTWFFSDIRVGSFVLKMMRGGHFSGSETPALAMTYIINILKRVLPLFYLIHKVKMPFKVMLPVKIANMPMFRAAVPVALFVFGIITLLTGAEGYATDFIGFNIANTVWLPKGRVHMVLYALLYIVILPVISEIVHRGLFMQTLRQFGDGCALIFTSVIAALTSSGTHAWIFTLTYSFIIGFFAIRTGSILTAIVMRTVISGCSYVLTFLRMSGLSSDMYMNIFLLVIIFCLTAGGIGTVLFMKKHSNRINLPFYGMYVSNSEKVMCMITCPWIILWLTLTVVNAMLGQVL